MNININQLYYPNYLYIQYLKNNDENDNKKILIIINKYLKNKFSSNYKKNKKIISFDDKEGVNYIDYDKDDIVLELSEKEIIDINNHLNDYNKELEKIKNIYLKIKNNKNFNILENNISYGFSKIFMNIKEITDYYKPFYDNIQNKKKITTEYKLVIFILDVIDILFNNYIDSIEYSIRLLKENGYIINHKEDYLTYIYNEKIKDDGECLYINTIDFFDDILFKNKNYNCVVINYKNKVIYFI